MVCVPNTVLSGIVLYAPLVETGVVTACTLLTWGSIIYRRNAYAPMLGRSLGTVSVPYPLYVI